MGNRLFAKFENGQGTETIEEHIERCLRIYVSLRQSFGDVPLYCGNPRFFKLLFYAVVIHDLGKAADGWQRDPQKCGFRHEVLSAYFVNFLDLDSDEKQAVALAVFTHHKRYSALRDSGYSGFFAELRQQLKDPWPLIEEIWSRLPHWSHAFGQSEGERRFIAFERLEDGYSLFLKKDILDEDMLDSRKRTQWLYLRGMLEICDHLGSGHANGIQLHTTTFREQLAGNILEFKYIQEKAGGLLGSCCILAPTGMGKTEASLLWADVNYAHTPEARLLYTLPYTASIHAMRSRLLKITGGGPESIAMLHGRNHEALYLEMKEQGDEDAVDKAKQMARQARELYAAVKVQTPHQLIMAVLGFRGFEKRLVELTNALIIVDEIHAYDAGMMARLLFALKAAVQTFHARVCIMSATFPSFLLAKIQKEIGIPDDHVIVAEEELPPPRHVIEIVDGTWAGQVDQVQEWLGQNKRVLVVCNTVRSAVHAFQAMCSLLPKGQARVLHGRFMMKDRHEIESLLKTVSLLVSTQVVEVSLNISFDALITEPAPVDALVQRMGRVNRPPTMDPLHPSPCLILMEEEKPSKVYDETRVKETIDCLRELLSVTRTPDERMIRQWVESVYRDGYSSEESKEFDTTMSSLARHFNRLLPGDYEKGMEDKWRKHLDTMSAVPSAYFGRHLELWRMGDGLEARQFEVHLPVRAFFAMKKMGIIKEFERESHTDYYVELPYDKWIGLHFVHDDNEE